MSVIVLSYCAATETSKGGGSFLGSTWTQESTGHCASGLDVDRRSPRSARGSGRRQSLKAFSIRRAAGQGSGT